MLRNTSQNRSAKYLSSKDKLEKENLWKQMSDKHSKHEEKSNLAQQLLILDHLGLLDMINDLGIELQKDKINLISVLLNKSTDNVKKYLNNLAAENSKIMTKSNFEFLIKTFRNSGLEEKAQEMEKILNGINEKRKNKKGLPR